MILPRIITAIIGIPVILLVIYAGGFPFFAFITFVIIMSLYEYSLMMKLALKPVDNFSLFLCGILFPVIFYLNGGEYSSIYNFLPFFISLSVILPWFIELFRKEKYLERVTYTIAGTLFISFNLSFLILLRDLKPYGRNMVFSIIICVWIMDTAAYFVGSKFGKNKLNDISPKKTIEGFVAGLLTALIFYYFAAGIFKENFSLKEMLLIGLLVSLAGQFSDLGESLVKRACGVKDSSNLLPGHGGFLDRFDSYIFISPIIYYTIIFMGH
ncbi:MAG: phosphatidate cytidylyltransferase [Elusimicrobiales bacterium]|jgi:phosphatidate cytidylyltransferase|nr:phosphatidate cytidylyltransferase [Elusimicrobiales bacterium]